MTSWIVNWRIWSIPLSFGIGSKGFWGVRILCFAVKHERKEKMEGKVKGIRKIIQEIVEQQGWKLGKGIFPRQKKPGRPIYYVHSFDSIEGEAIVNIIKDEESKQRKRKMDNLEKIKKVLDKIKLGSAWNLDMTPYAEEICQLFFVPVTTGAGKVEPKPDVQFTIQADGSKIAYKPDESRLLTQEEQKKYTAFPPDFDGLLKAQLSKVLKAGYVKPPESMEVTELAEMIFNFKSGIKEIKGSLQSFLLANHYVKLAELTREQRYAIWKSVEAGGK